MREVSKVMKDQEPLTVATRNGERDIGRGSIINLGSAHSYVALPGKIPYVTSKFAVLGMTKTAGMYLFRFLPPIRTSINALQHLIVQHMVYV